MPRKYVPKVKSYSENNLQEAIEKVQKGEQSYREAESKYKVDKSLLWRKVYNYNTSKQGRKTVLSKEEEDDLADKIKLMAKWGWALTRREISNIVHMYIIQNNIKNNFKNNCPGKDWMKLFFMRNGLVGKKMEQLEKSRRQATSDPFIVYGFYDTLQEVLTSLDLHDKPHHIFNLDETSFSADPTRIKGVTGKGQKAHRIIQGSGKNNTTVLGCISAGGTLFPPLIIFKGQNLWSNWKGTKDIPGTTYACSENGWMMTSIFNEWFANFCKTVTKRPLLIIFDGHITHLDPATIALAVRENVALLKLPPHTTDLLQPMGRSCFGPIKYKWNERLIKWQRMNQRSLSKSEFCDLLCEVWREGLSKEVIQNAFKVTGLYPINKDVYPKERLDPLKLDKYYQNLLHSHSIPNPLNVFEDSPAEIDERSVSPSIINDSDVLLSLTPTISVSAQNIEGDSGFPAQPTKIHPIVPQKHTNAPECCTSEISIQGTSADYNMIIGPSSSFETLLLSKIKHTKQTTGKRRKIDGKGKLLTSEEYLKSIENLELKQKKQKVGEPKKKKQKLKSIVKNSDTETDVEEEVPYEDESDLDDISLSALFRDERDEQLDEPNDESNVNSKSESIIQQDENISPEAVFIKNLTTEPKKNYSGNLVDNLEYGIGDFILVAHTSKKNLKQYYIARIDGKENDENFIVIYLKRAKKKLFAYPDTHIIYSIRKDEVVMKLPNPTQKSKRSGFMFDIDLEKYNIN